MSVKSSVILILAYKYNITSSSYKIIRMKAAFVWTQKKYQKLPLKIEMWVLIYTFLYTTYISFLLLLLTITTNLVA